jgi:hypothetical protein
LVSLSRTRVIDRLRSKSVLAQYDPAAYVGTAPNWLALLSTRAVARWACNVAAEIVGSVLDSIPASELKNLAEFFYRANFQLVGAATNVNMERGSA